MKPAQLVLIITFVIVALTVTIWLGRDDGHLPSVAEKPAEPKTAEDELPLPATGPYGKAVAAELIHNFGSVEKGDEGSHVFVIKNEGDGPLRVKTGKTSCGQCTFAQTGEDEIPPGKFGEVKINWTIKTPSGKFRQTAEVFTTDPDRRKLVFAIEGLIDAPLHLVPDGTWNLGDMSETEPTVAEGLLYTTRFADIPIERAESSNPLISVTWEPAAAEILAEKEAKSGYKITVTIAPGSTIGPVREHVKLHTNVGTGTVIEFDLVGKRPGSVELKGRGWNAESSVALLSEFPSAAGTKSKLVMYVRNCPGELQVQQADSDGSRVKVRVSPTGRIFGKSKVYDVELEVAPGPPERRHGKDSAPIVLKLNHPTVTEFKLFVDYHAK